MARMSVDTPLADRRFAHKMRMAGKKLDAARRAQQLTPMQSALARMPAGAFGALVHASRHTLDPHTNLREIARNERRGSRAAL